MVSSFIINLFGTGIRYWCCEVPIEMYDEMKLIKEKKQVGWENLLFDFDFLNHFGFNHWSELSILQEQIGFLVIPENRVEIKSGSKFITRFRAVDLNNTGTLFRLYNTNLAKQIIENKPLSKSFILINYEKGLIAKYQFITEYFKIENLVFHLETFGESLILKNINHKSVIIPRIADDSLTISTKVFEI